MKKIFAIVLSLSIILTINIYAKLATKHHFICIDNGSKKNTRLVHVNQFAPKESWNIKIPAGARSIQLIGNDKILINHSRGATEYFLKTGKKTGWEITKYREICTSLRLKNDHTLIANSNYIYELDSQKKEIKKIKLPAKKNSNMRVISLSPNNTILYSQHIKKSPFFVYEINMDGKLLWKSEIPGKGYKHLLTKDKTIINTCGTICKIVTINRKGEILSFVGGKKEHPEADFSFFSGYDLLKNGNIVVADWHGHNYKGKSSHLVEFDKNNKIVWRWFNKKVKRLTNVLVIE